MGFLDNTPDLKGTKFTLQNLDYARQFLTSAIGKHDPAWLDKPVGPLRVYWNADGTFSRCYVLEFCRVLDLLSKKVTGESGPILVDKFKKLLRPGSKREFRETYTELQVASILSERVSPIALDPLVPRDQLDASDRPPTPDLGIRLPGGDVLIEVTVLYFGALDEWDQAAEYFQSELGTLMRKEKLRRVIHLELPLKFRSVRMSHSSIEALAGRIANKESGGLNLLLDDDYVGTLQWEAMPHITAQHQDELIELSDGMNFATAGTDEPQTAFAYSRRLAEEDHSELLVRSIRNTLKRKRKQFPHEAPYLLTIKLGHHRMRSESVAAVLQQRIWPNPDYEWITGVMLFVPGRQFEKADPAHSLTYFLNPNTRSKPGKALMKLLEGERQFHLRNGQYYDAA